MILELGTRILRIGLCKTKTSCLARSRPCRTVDSIELIVGKGPLGEDYIPSYFRLAFLGDGNGYCRNGSVR